MSTNDTPEEICPVCGLRDIEHEGPGKTPTMAHGFGCPPRLAVDGRGYVWRVYDEHWSMAPVNPDNSPIPEPVTFYEPAAVLNADRRELARVFSQALCDWDEFSGGDGIACVTEDGTEIPWDDIDLAEFLGLMFAGVLTAMPVSPAEEAMADALRLIDRNGCETFTSGRCSDPNSGRTRGAKYGADQWCDPCIAAAALVSPAPAPRAGEGPGR